MNPWLLHFALWSGLTIAIVAARGETFAAQCGPAATADHLLITEVKTGPTAGEFVEIHNPTGTAIDLSTYRLYNGTNAPLGCFYYNVVTGTECGANPGTFSLQFPAGASIGPGEFQVIAVTGAFNYCATYFPGGACVKPTYEIPPPGADDSSVPNMRGTWDTTATTFATFGFLNNASDDLALFQWDGASATVRDVDYIVWGTNLAVRTDKTGVAGYEPDTPVASQFALPGAISNSMSHQRVCFNEGTEAKAGGNGLTGHNETSEDLAATWVVASPTPGGPPVLTPPPPPLPSLAWVANSGSNSVSVIDTETNLVVATVPVGRIPLAVALSPDGSRAYVVNSGSNSVSVVDAVTRTVVATLVVGATPSALAVRPDGHRVYVTNLRSGTVSVIDTATTKVAATVPVGVSPVDIVISAGGNHAYVTNAGSNSLSVIDTATDAVVATVPVGRGPAGVAISP